MTARCTAWHVEGLNDPPLFTPNFDIDSLRFDIDCLGFDIDSIGFDIDCLGFDKIPKLSITFGSVRKASSVKPVVKILD